LRSWLEPCSRSGSRSSSPPSSWAFSAPPGCGSGR